MRRPSIDPARLASLVMRPGVDPTVHLTLAQVTDVAYDADHGIFADVHFLPTGTDETVLVGAPYAGSGFGMYGPVAVDDIVLVALVRGQADEAGVIIARLWSAADKPPSTMAGANGDPTEHVVLHVRSGKNLILHTEGGGKVFVGGTDGSEPIPLGTTLKNYLDAQKTWADGHIHNDPVSGVTSAPTVASPSVPTIASENGEVT